MKALISNPLSPHFTTFVSRFPSIPSKSPIFISFQGRKSLPTTRKATALCSPSSFYGGWEDLSSGSDSGESTQLSNFLNSLGVDDKKYVFVYLLGFVCALAVSRVRVSSIVVFPACFLVFAAGFSFGIVNGGSLNELKSLVGNTGKNNKKKRLKDVDFKASIENLRNLVDLFGGFDLNIMSLKNSMRKDVTLNRITKSDLESYIEGVESIGQSALHAKSVIEGCIDSMVVDANDISTPLNQKPSDQKKEGEGKGFDFSQFIAGIREKSVGSKPNKVKDIAKRDSSNMEVTDNSPTNILAPAAEEKMIASQSNGNKRTSDDNLRVQAAAERKVMNRMARNLMEMEDGAKRVFDRDDYILKRNKMHFVENRHISFDMNNQNTVQTWNSEDRLLDLDLSVSLKHDRTNASFGEGQNFKKINGNHMPYNNMETTAEEAYNQSTTENGFASSPSSQIVDDMKFNEYLMEANALLKQARDYLKNRGDEEDAEGVLYKSAELLSKAIDMRPMSLLAVGQLGNTYLLHGELKLKLSRKLRALLERPDPRVIERLDDEVTDREKLLDYLVSVCEECEQLLVNAGRKYRMALSIDGNDMRALYNWGLALSFRAQLIADIGPEAAFDADKVYLAAIDKFNAMMSKSNDHAPDALFRWGVALQQRSRLQTRNIREKVKLLSQAKRLYEDALLMDSSNPQVREALSTCMSELNYGNNY